MNFNSNLMLTADPAIRRRGLDSGHRVQNRTLTCGLRHFPARTRSVKHRARPDWRHAYLQAMREADRLVLQVLNRSHTPAS